MPNAAKRRRLTDNFIVVDDGRGAYQIYCRQPQPGPADPIPCACDKHLAAGYVDTDHVHVAIHTSTAASCAAAVSSPRG